MNTPQADVTADAIIAFPNLKPLRKGIAFHQICNTTRDEFGQDPRTVVRRRMQVTRRRLYLCRIVP